MYSLVPTSPVSRCPVSTRPTEPGTGMPLTISEWPKASTTTRGSPSWLMARSRAMEGLPASLKPSAATPVASPRTLLNSRSRSNLRRVNPTAMYMIRMVTATANTITAPSLARIEVSRSSGRVAI